MKPVWAHLHTHTTYTDTHIHMLIVSKILSPITMSLELVKMGHFSPRRKENPLQTSTGHLLRYAFPICKNENECRSKSLITEVLLREHEAFQ